MKLKKKKIIIIICGTRGPFKELEFIELEFIELEFHLNIFKELKFHELEFYTRNSSSMTSSSLNGTRVPQNFFIIFFKFDFVIT